MEHILEFLGEHSRNIVVQGVHMVFNAQVTFNFVHLNEHICCPIMDRNKFGNCKFFNLKFWSSVSQYPNKYGTVLLFENNQS